MSDRVVLEVEPIGSTLHVRAKYAPFVIQGAQNFMPLQLQDPDQIGSYDVRARGNMLRDALHGHAGISLLLDRLGETPHGQISQLFLMFGQNGADAEAINWEMLCDKQDRFVALDRRWPIARIVDPMASPPRPHCMLETPVRMMAVISALGIVDQRREWELIRDAVLAGRGIGLEIELRVLVGLPALHDVIEQEINAGLGQVQVSSIPKIPALLLQQIQAWSPHLLHFFCHGHADARGQQLELATATDHVQHAADPGAVTEGSVGITVDMLESMAGQLANTWLVVLNCCSGGQTVSSLQSMAARIVTGGAPAVIAMMEPVDANDAYVFTRAFYPAAFQEVRRAATDLDQQPDKSKGAAVEWAPAMYFARSAISQVDGRDADSSPEWSLPILYVRGLEAQTLMRPPVLANNASLGGYLQRAEITARGLRTAGQHLSLDERKEILARMMAGIPESLWPSPEGRFDDAG